MDGYLKPLLPVPVEGFDTSENYVLEPTVRLAYCKKLLEYFV
jgi:hypothetical protein